MLPEWLGLSANLETLYLSNNRLASLPESLRELTSLRTLFLSNNTFSALPESVRGMTSLENLYVSNNQIAMLPEWLGQFAALKHLHASNNCLTALPISLWQLTSLQTLALDNNQLTELPESLGQLAGLRQLSLGSNQLTVLPQSTGRLTELQMLWLQSNQLNSLPESLRELVKLELISLQGNSGLGLPDEVMRTAVEKTPGYPKKSAREILEYYFRIRGESGRALGECKLIVVGRGGAGKTSLVKRLNAQSFNSDEPETHGINILPLRCSTTRGPVTSRVWDFGGQVILHSMHEFFLTARSLYLLVLGERDDMLERDAAYWLQLIRSYAGRVPVVVALNKSAGRKRQFDRQSLEDAYGPILSWVATECSEEDEDKAGIVTLQQQISTALDSVHMDSVHRKFPDKWFAIKHALEEMKESYLSYDAFIKLCASKGESDSKEQAALAGDLHDLGVALNYGRDPRLRDTTVLKPDWLANGIYAVLRANDLDKQLPAMLNQSLAPDGVVTADSMTVIHAKAQAWGMLRVIDYPAEKRAFLLRLMGVFHLSYPLDDEGKRQLVPALLPLNPPHEALEPAAAPDRVRLRYEFQVVPAPLLPWFIARTFSLIPHRLHWRRGTMLVYGNASARVWTTQDERYVFVTVGGIREDCKDLLTMIRGTFDELFGDYRGLQVTEQWEHKGNWVPRSTLEEFGLLKSYLQNEADDLMEKRELEEAGVEES
jgi:internalin A